MGQTAHYVGQVICTHHLPRDKFCQKYLCDPAFSPTCFFQTTVTLLILIFAFFAIVKHETKGLRIKIFGKYKHAKFNTHVENSNHRKSIAEGWKGRASVK